MPEVMYGGRQGERLQLEVDPELVAVRTRSGRSLRAGPVAGPEAAVLDGMDLVLEFPEAGVEVYRRRNGAGRSVAEVKEALEQAPDTRFAGGVLVDPAGEPVLYTENLFVKFRDDRPVEDCRLALLEAGLRSRTSCRTPPTPSSSPPPRAPARTSSPSPSGCCSGTTSSTATPSWCASWAGGRSSRSSGTWPRPQSAARASAPAPTWPRPTP